jgi:hypothetical protein
LQAILSLLVAVFGVTMLAGDYKEIRSNIDLQKKYYNSIINFQYDLLVPHVLISLFRTWSTLNNRPSFYTFNHRGHVFSPTQTRSASGKGALEAN